MSRQEVNVFLIAFVRGGIVMACGVILGMVLT